MTKITLFIIIVFLAGIYFLIQQDKLEGMKGMGTDRCPNMLIQKGSKYYLYNTKLAEVPGVNPISFNNLEDYVEFIDWQRSQGIRCPVLYVQETYDTQGNITCKVRPCVSEPQGGLPPTTASLDSNATTFPDKPGIPDFTDISTTSDGSTSAIPSSQLSINPNDRYPNLERQLLINAGRNDPPYNQNSYPAYDDTSFYHGVVTPLDQMDINQEAKAISPNAMDPNWGGGDYTQNLIDIDYYKANEVYKVMGE
jgi:hypothetical protein